MAVLVLGNRAASPAVYEDTKVPVMVRAELGLGPANKLGALSSLLEVQSRLAMMVGTEVSWVDIEA